MQNVMPLLEVRARRVGGANYQVPVEVRADRKTTLGIRWLVNYSRLRGERTMYERVAGEIMDASNGTGAAVKNVKIPTRWQKQIKRLLITVGNGLTQLF